MRPVGAGRELMLTMILSSLQRLSAVREERAIALLT